MLAEPLSSTPMFVARRSLLDVDDRDIVPFDRDPHLVRLLEQAGVLDVSIGAWLCRFDEHAGIDFPLAYMGRVPWTEIQRSIDTANRLPDLNARLNEPFVLPEDDDYVLCAVGNEASGRAVLFLRQRAWHPSIRAKLDEAIDKIRQLIHTVWIMRADAERRAMPQVQQERGAAHGLAIGLADQCPFGMMILDVDQFIHLANASARRLLAKSDMIGTVDNRLTLGDAHDAIRFQVTLRAVFLGAGGQHKRRTIAITGPGGKPLLLSISRLSDGTEGPRACIIMTRPGATAEPDIQPLAELFNLTPVETRLICQLLKGLNVQDAARALQLKVQTVRTYLKMIFQKTGTHRQVELVQLMQNGSLPGLD